MDINKLLEMMMWPPNTTREQQRRAWERACEAVFTARAKGRVSPRHPAVRACETAVKNDGLLVTAPPVDAKN